MAGCCELRWFTHHSLSHCPYFRNGFWGDMCIYRMDLNFRGTKLSRIENFRVFIFADARPQYYIKYIDYISILICASHINHKAKHVWAARRVGVAIAKQ